MKAEYFNYFILAVSEVLKDSCGLSVTKKGLTIQPRAPERDDVMILLLVHGELEGSMVFSTSRETAIAFASRMYLGFPLSEYDRMAQNAMTELSYRIMSRAAANLSAGGHKYSIPAPTIIAEKEKVPSYLKEYAGIEIEFLTEAGPFTLNLKIQEGNKDKSGFPGQTGE